MEFDLKAYLAERRKQVDGALLEIFGEEAEPCRVASAMTYSLMAGGKRLRPVLCLAAAEAVGGNMSAAIQAACALELIHTYSLIHDDLPAMDDDKLRRGNPTCHVAFDEATALLAGDALLTLAFEVLASSDAASEQEALRWLRITRDIAQAAGYRGMIGGQMRDIAAENTALELEELEQMHALKTGALIRVSVTTGAILGGGTEPQIDCLTQYARKIGLAFQVTDDILNVEGDPLFMGKAVGTDEERNKSTYPSIMGLEASKAFARQLIDDALTALEGFDRKSDPLRAIARYVIERQR